MLEKIRMKKKANDPVYVGDVIKYGNELFVVINILSVQVFSSSVDALLVYDCLCQQTQKPNIADEYMTTQAEIMYQAHEYNEISEVGEFIYDEGTGIWVKIDAILSVRMEEKNLFVKYEFTPVNEWSEREISRAIGKERRKHMRLLRSKTNDIANDNIH